MDIENLWGTFKEDSYLTPKEVLDAQGEYLREMTDNKVYAVTEELSEAERKAHGFSDEDTFAFKFVIKSDAIPTYQFPVLALRHDITIYPIKFNVADEIKEALNMESGLDYEVHAEDVLNMFLSSVLQAEYVHQVVSVLKKMAQ